MDEELLGRSISEINYENVTPFVAPDGNPGVSGKIYTNTQFFEMVCCFNMTTMSRENFR
ncbi:MAG: hypothetical protein K5779_01515 [Saccharofermentans sp.]|nr:hypothetical protein [Saccharofermentans sp.]